MPVGPVIVNNTPLSALWSINHLELLKDLYREIFIPQAVYEEFLAKERAKRQKVLQKADWIKSTPLNNPRQALVYVGLDRGEAEVPALADELSARLMVMDERKGRRYAKRLGLPLTGTLGILLAAKDKGLIPAVSPLIHELLENGLYLSPEIVSKTLEIAGENR